MTRVKGYLSGFLALLLVFAMMPMVAFGADHTLTIDGAVKGHQYKVYQLLQGDVSGLMNGSGTVSNRAAGDNLLVSGDTDEAKTKAVEAVINLIKDDEGKDKLSGAELGSALYAYVNLGSEPAAILTSERPSESVPDGYYLIVDYLPGQVAEGDAASRFIVTVSGVQVNGENTVIKPKVDVPTLDKTIVNTNQENAPLKQVGQQQSDGKVNTAAIGDVINYQVVCRVPNMDGYETYQFIIHDTLSNGLTLVTDDAGLPVASLTINGNPIPFDRTISVDGQSFTLAISNLKVVDGAVENAEIVATYSARVNENANVGTGTNDANTNTAYLEYSNDPRYSGVGNNVTGNTVESTTYTFVNQLTIKKVDENGSILPGAEFTLIGTNLNELVIKAGQRYVEAEDGTYYALKDGRFTETEPTPQTVNDYVPATEGVYQKYSLVTYEGTSNPLLISQDYRGFVDETGKLTFTGLNGGSYTIKESVTPEGYNTITDITFTLVAQYNGMKTDGTPDVSWTWDGLKPVDVTDGVATYTIENHKGLQLPSTGGIGTVIFTVVGAVVIIGAIAFLVMRRRHSDSE